MTQTTQTHSLALGQTPPNESLILCKADQRGYNGIQCLAYIMQLRRIHGDEPMGSTLCRIGTDEYGITVVYRHDPNNKYHADYGAKITKSDKPDKWDKIAISMLNHWIDKYGGVKEE